MRNPLEPDGDPFGPPAENTTVGCLHCGQEYDSYRIEWRVEDTANGPHGFWCCPIPGCDGRGFGFDILPTDPNYHDEHGGWRGGWFTDDGEPTTYEELQRRDLLDDEPLPDRKPRPGDDDPIPF
jgi:hypothetical protein